MKTASRPSSAKSSKSSRPGRRSERVGRGGKNVIEERRCDPYVAPRSERYVAKIERNRFWKGSQILCRLGTTLAFDLKVYGAHNIPKTGGVLLVSNHQSYLDPVLLSVKLDRPLSFLARSGLFENPYFGWLIRELNAFPVKQGAGDVGAMKEVIRRLKEGHLLNVYPEGSRTEDGELLPVQPGVALVVRRAGVPVVPAIIDGSWQSWPKGTKLPRAVPITVTFGQPVRLDHLKPERITSWIDSTMHRMFDEVRGRR